MVPVQGEEFFVDDGGPAEAPCVLFSHSIMTSSAMWRGQLQRLRAAGYRAIAYDARGHGRSVVSAAPYTLRQLADDVIALMDAMGIARAHFVGLSLGGMIAFDLAARCPQRLHSAVICDARADSPPAFAAPWEERIALAREQGMRPLVAPTIARWFAPSFQEGAEAQAVQAMLRATPPQGFIGTANALQDFDLRAGLPGIKLPVTMICGENDGVLPAEMASLTGQIPDAVLEMIPAAGHLPNIENPAAFDAALMRHLARAGR
jgi:3-oxoadipate enol-lactonase